MAELSHDIMKLLSTEIFKQLLNSDAIQINKLNTALTLLIQGGIPFDLEFSPGTRRDAPAAELTIYINPTTTIQFTISFEAGSTIFGDNRA
jgi:hypothetical protein